MRTLVIAAIVAILTDGCQPARSEIFVEMVNPELVKNLVSQADSIAEIPAGSFKMDSSRPLLWVRGERLIFSSEAKSTVLWYDEQGKLSGLLEYENNKLKDSIAFYPNGQRMFTLIIDKDGLASGPARFYYPDGRVREDGRFTGGIKTGVWREFNPDGRLVTSREYDRYGKPSR